MYRLSKSLAALSLCAAAACGSSNATGPSPAPGDITIVQGASTLTTAAFTPNPQTVALAGTAQIGVRWVNRDVSGGYGGGTATTHQIMSDNGAFATSEPLGGGATYSVAFTTAGTYHYHCAIHPNMVGTITVTQ